MLEECRLPDFVRTVELGRGEQFAPDFLRMSPNNRIPTIIEHDPPHGESMKDALRANVDEAIARGAFG